MTRRRAVWIAAVVAVALAVSYFVVRRSRAARSVAATPVVTLPPSPAPTAAALAEPAPPVVAGEATAASAAERPLPTWVRATIVAAALVAFFAVSLIATKRV
ncbi:MAG: hypothetical protein JWO88_3476 [Frankiales bacterium]|nr:hypothetical protein [Frankiales bacterium]